METKKQVIVYVDGYNFYYGLRNGGPKWKRLYWLDIVKFFERDPMGSGGFVTVTKCPDPCDTQNVQTLVTQAILTIVLNVHILLRCD